MKKRQLKNMIDGVNGLLNTQAEIQNNQERVDENTRQAFLRKYQRADNATPDMLAGLEGEPVDSASRAKAGLDLMDLGSPKSR